MNYHFSISFLDYCKSVTQIPNVIVAVTHYRYEHISPLFLFPSTSLTYITILNQKYFTSNKFFNDSRGGVANSYLVTSIANMVFLIFHEIFGVKYWPKIIPLMVAMITTSVM